VLDYFIVPHTIFYCTAATPTAVSPHLPLLTRSYGGFNKAAVCPKHYPDAAPWNICSHVAFVEMDSQMTFKQAMAYLATGDEQYAQSMLNIVSSWALNNKEWGLQVRSVVLAIVPDLVRQQACKAPVVTVSSGAVAAPGALHRSTYMLLYVFFLVVV
jgi:hypothetical protein